MNWIEPLAGGLLIGSAAVLLYASLGRIAGISGIAYGVCSSRDGERHWRLAFLGGLVLGGWLAVISGHSVPVTSPGTSGPLLLVSGLLVGLGTRLANGCTSGHGVCGLARRSPRSLVSVVVFMLTGMLVATLLGRLT